MAHKLADNVIIIVRLIMPYIVAFCFVQFRFDNSLLCKFELNHEIVTERSFCDFFLPAERSNFCQIY